MLHRLHLSNQITTYHGDLVQKLDTACDSCNFEARTSSYLKQTSMKVNVPHQALIFWQVKKKGLDKKTSICRKAYCSKSC